MNSAEEGSSGRYVDSNVHHVMALTSPVVGMGRAPGLDPYHELRAAMVTGISAEPLAMAGVPTGPAAHYTCAIALVVGVVGLRPEPSATASAFPPPKPR